MLVINASKCLQCGGCISLCPAESLFLSFDRLICDPDSCTLCEICVNFCPVDALEINRAVKV